MEAINNDRRDVERALAQAFLEPQEIDKNEKRHHRAVWLTIVPIAITMLLLITRTSFSLTRFVFSISPCDQQESYNTSLDEEDQDDSPIHEKHHRFTYLVYFTCSILHWFEYVYLFYGSYCYFFCASKWTKDFCKALRSSTTSFMLKKKTKLIAISLYFLLFLVVSVGVSIVGMIHDIRYPHYQSLEYKCQTLPREIAYTYYSLSIISHILTTFVRVMFALAAATCGAIWLEMTPDEVMPEQTAPLLPTTLQPDRDKDWEAAVKKYDTCMAEYEAKLDKVKPIYKMFRSWFVIQWVIYLTGLVSDISYLLRPWFFNSTVDVLKITYVALYCMYDAQVLICTYLAALKMNAYLRRFIRHKQAECIKKDEIRSMSQLAYSRNTLRIKMIPKSDFIPIIPGTGINLSLRGPGFIIGTAIAVIGLLAAMSTI